MLGAFLVFALGLLVAGHDGESRSVDRGLLWTSAACSAVGAMICLGGLGLGVERWELFGAGLLALASFLLLVAVAGRLPASRGSEGLSEWIRGYGRGWFRFAVAGAGLLSLGLVGWLFWSGAELAPGLLVKAFPVYQACSDGVCSVNECTSPGPCGKQAVGQLKEGEMAEITCQTRGGRIPASGPGGGSKIWDKLADGNYVSDYYVKTPGRGRFTPGIPRCSEGDLG
ncbi:MAG TPA: hypothetical protein VNN15_04375 [Solirubrobacterales bacterium]|nr:hypothetical protein [Solirubrobacterales bacterium]